ncbi:hypothetical protein Tco_1478050, partial [Tanacetum coccineum]
FCVSESGKCEVLRGSKLPAVCPLTWGRPLPSGSTIRPLVTIGEECLLVILSLVFKLSRLPFAVVEPTGLDLPAERGLSGELSLELDPAVQGVEDNACPAEAEDVVDVEREGVQLLRVGVDGREGSCSSFARRSCRRRAGSSLLEGVEPREGVVRADGVDGLAVVDERLVGVDGLIKRTLEDLFIELDLTGDLLLAVTGVG